MSNQQRFGLPVRSGASDAASNRSAQATWSDAVTPRDQDANPSARRQPPAQTVDARARDSIARVHHDLKQLGQESQDARRDIELLIAGVESHLDLPGQPPAPTALLEAVRARIRQFEVGHPRLMASLEQLLETLSSSGI